MTKFLTNDNINWKKYLFIFDQFKFVQCIFIIPSSDVKYCLKIGTNKLINIYDITCSKILKLKNIGPFITKKELTNNYSNNNLEDSIIDFFLDHKYYKWLAITDTHLEFEYFPNYFVNFPKLYIDSFCFIIPHRNRNETLKITKDKIKNYIIKNNLYADIWIIHQNNSINWNKGTTLNIGFKILESFYNYFIFNDADIYFEPLQNFIIPKNNQVIHFYGYDHCLGGIFILNKKDFIKVNGFSNKYFNWGREDVDFQDRILNNKVNVNKDYINKGSKELAHKNNKNYWNYKENTIEYLIAKKLYNLNLDLYNKKEFTDGINNLFEGNTCCNCKIVYILKVLKNQIGSLNLKSLKNNITINFNNNQININKNTITFDINKEINLIFKKENNKYYFEIKTNKSNIQIEIQKYNQQKIEVNFNNLKKEYMITYTPFINDKIYYSFYSKFDLNSYNLYVNY